MKTNPIFSVGDKPSGSTQELSGQKPSTYTNKLPVDSSHDQKISDLEKARSYKRRYDSLNLDSVAVPSYDIDKVVGSIWRSPLAVLGDFQNADSSHDLSEKLELGNPSAQIIKSPMLSHPGNDIGSTAESTAAIYGGGSAYRNIRVLAKLAQEAGQKQIDREYDKSVLAEGIIPSDVTLLGGHGASLDTNKGKFIDCQSMTFNCILGQNDPWVKMKQLAYLMSDKPSFHSTRFGSDAYYSLPERLAKLKVGGIENPVIAHRQCNGSDAVEQTIAAAYKHRGDRTKIISFTDSYHGQNWTAFSVSGLQEKNRFMEKSSSVVFIDPPKHNQSLKPGVPLTANEEEVLANIDKHLDNSFALIMEPIQINNALHMFSQGFLAEVAKRCQKAQVPLIFDEVQTGFGWLGKLSAAELYNVKPDMIAAGKAITAGNGPLSLVIAEPRFRNLDSTMSAKTNGGDVRALTAAHAVLDRLLGVPPTQVPDYVNGQLRDELLNGLLQTVPVRSEFLTKSLMAVKSKHPQHISEIRGTGFVQGLYIVLRVPLISSCHVKNFSVFNALSLRDEFRESMSICAC